MQCYLVLHTFCYADGLRQDEKFVVFSDIHPAAEHHYLVCPRSHIRNAKCLTKNDLELGVLCDFLSWMKLFKESIYK